VTTDSRIVIVGAGQAGGRTAQALRRFGHAGSITILGDEIHAPYERPPLSKDILLGRVLPESLRLLSDEGWHAAGVKLCRAATATSIDRAARQVWLDNGDAVEYDTLVLATGARAKPFPGHVQAATELFQLRTLEDAERLRPRLVKGRHLAVVGAGFIGMELAASARLLGVEVTLIEASPLPLARLLPSAFAERLVALHRRQGVTVLLDAPVASLAPGRILLADGRSLSADTIVVGVGARANDELAARAGITVRDGVIVDACGRSGDPAVFAVGDVARHVDPAAGLDQRLESWRNAEDGAQVAAAAICGAPLPQRSAPWFWTDQYGRNIQLAGWPGDVHECTDFGDADGGPALSYYCDAGVVRGVIGIDCGRDVRVAMKLIEAGHRVAVDDLAPPRALTRPTKVGAGIRPLAAEIGLVPPRQ
jgi:NADPH-dependent 2,4-dienoyl-CoA reductase/sulfur reductase-like enzyme